MNANSFCNTFFIPLKSSIPPRGETYIKAENTQINLRFSPWGLFVKWLKRCKLIYASAQNGVRTF